MPPRRTLRAPALALALTAACATTPRTPLRLPGPDAPLEVRAMTYRANMASVHNTLWRTGQVRVGDDPVERPFQEMRPVFENAPEAAELLRGREQQLRAGWGLFGGGIAIALGGAALLPLTVDRIPRDERISPLVPSLVSLAGVAMLAVGSFVIAGAESRVTYAVDAYNRWLWDALTLPRAGRAVEPLRPMPATSPLISPPSMGAAPWSAPP
jgi:hypothetical protein